MRIRRFSLIMDARGLAPLAARPAPTLPTSGFAFELRDYVARKAKCFALAKQLPPSSPLELRKFGQKEKTATRRFFFLVDARGLEPPASTMSR